MRNYLKITLSTLIVCLIALQLKAQELESQYDHMLMELFPNNGPGGTALVARKGEILYHKAFGKSNLELGVDMDIDNVFRIGSITKQFTACAILRLMEEGKLALDDDIQAFMEDYPTHGHEITVEHLLTHTSGIKSYTGLEKWTSEERKRDFTPEEMVDYFKNEPMDFAPGEEWRYNNSAYFLLGYIIESISGKTYAEYIEEQFFKPLGMEDSYYGNTSNIIPNRAAGYQQQDGEFTNADFLSMTQPYSAGSLLSTVSDLMKWYEAVMDYEVVGQASLEKAHSSSTLNNGKLTGYGYGWSTGYIQESPMIGHGGGINGFLTASLYLPEEEIFVAVFSNCNCHAPGNIANRMAAIALEKPFEWEAIELSEEALKSYEGAYLSEYDGKRTISFEDGKLYSMRTGGSRYQIHPYNKDQFFIENSLTTLHFVRDANGDLWSVKSKSTGLPIDWIRTNEEVIEIEAIELTESEMDKFLGEYQLAENFIIEISREGTTQFAKATGQPRVAIVPFEPNKFYIENIDAQIIFNFDAGGIVESLTLLQNGEHLAKKLK